MLSSTQSLDSDDDFDLHESRVPPERRTTISLPTPSEPEPLPKVSRVIDDEDAELQAALKASLEELPEGFVPPTTPPRQPVHVSQPPILSREQPSRLVPAVPSDDEAEDVQESSGKGKAREESPEIEKLDVDEMRRRRLAKFGVS
jgi:ataxin-3